MPGTYFLKPWTPAPAPSELTVELSRTGDMIRFAFEMNGDLSQVVFAPLKPKAERKRVDGLWETTCLELFLGTDNENYFEFNFSPAGDWNAYAFDSYRKGMRPAEADVVIEDVGFDREKFRMRGSLRGRFFSRAVSDVGATAVVETYGKQKHYWAVKHAGTKPDFHLRSGFSIQLKDSSASGET